MNEAGTVGWVAESLSRERTVDRDASGRSALEAAGFAVEQVSAADLDGSEVARLDCLVFETAGGADTVESIRGLRERCPSIPVVALARDGDESLAHETVAAGAWEYVPATDRDGLVAAVERAVSQREGRGSGTTRDADAERRVLSESVPDPVAEYVSVDGEPVVTAINSAFAETFGYERDDAVGESLNDLVVPDQRESEATSLDERLETADHLEAEIERETVDGRRDFLFRNVAVDGDRGADGCAVYVDISRQRSRERRLQEQNDRLNEFTSVVSHDLRNPVSAAKNRIELARRTGDDDHLEDAQAALNRTDELLRDLLRLARQGERLGETEPVSLAAVAHTAWDHVATGEATLRTAGDRTVVADRGRLTQLLENLFVNAVTHGAENGSGIEVRVGVDDEGCLFVEDDGCGIPTEDRQNVFESGYTTATDGTGYGLAIVRQVARAHAWNVCVTESAAGGARFEFEGVAFGES